MNQEGKPNWAEVRENFYGYNSRYEARSVGLIEKLVQEFRSVCQQVIQRNNFLQRATPEQAQGFKLHPNSLPITPEEAEQFYLNTNLLKFIRKTILFNNRQTFNSHADEYIEEASNLPEDSPYQLPIPNYKPEIHDL